VEVKTYNFKTEQWLPRSREEVFRFFADASHLEILTPPWLNFKILTPGPIQMKPGTLIDYHITLHDVTIHWQSEILVWEPPYRFVDEQCQGPYRHWIHEHTFSDHEGGTLVGDEVEYAVPGGAMVQKLFVAPDLHRIFDYKRQRLREVIGKARGPYTPASELSLQSQRRDPVPDL
jgi:ligand-binding SRPBCC domain-containing protein